MRSTVSEFNPRRMSRLSSVQIVLSAKFGATIRPVLRFVLIARDCIRRWPPLSMRLPTIKPLAN